MTAEWRTALALQAAYQAEAAIKRQRLIAEDIKRRGLTQGKSELGRRVGIIDPVHAAQLRGVHGQKCFADPDFLNWVLKNSPELRVPE